MLKSLYVWTMKRHIKRRRRKEGRKEGNHGCPASCRAPCMLLRFQFIHILCLCWFNLRITILHCLCADWMQQHSDSGKVLKCPRFFFNPEFSLFPPVCPQSKLLDPPQKRRRKRKTKKGGKMRCIDSIICSNSTCNCSRWEQTRVYEEMMKTCGPLGLPRELGGIMKI